MDATGWMQRVAKGLIDIANPPSAIRMSGMVFHRVALR
jgi:hypothetical protein